MVQEVTPFYQGHVAAPWPGFDAVLKGIQEIGLFYLFEIYLYDYFI